MKLNFKMSELLKSSTATKHHINNQPTPQVMDNLLELIVNCLQPIREHLRKPVIVTSGYRCKKLNQMVGGAINSHHMLGTCADFHVNGMTINTMFDLIKKSNIQYTQMICEKNQWIHIEYDKNNLKRENLIYDGKRYILDKN